MRRRFALIGTWIENGPESRYVGSPLAVSRMVDRTGTWSLFAGSGGGCGLIDSRGIKGGQGQDFTLNWFIRAGSSMSPPKRSDGARASCTSTCRTRTNQAQSGIDALGFTLGYSWDSEPGRCQASRTVGRDQRPACHPIRANGSRARSAGIAESMGSSSTACAEGHREISSRVWLLIIVNLAGKVAAFWWGGRRPPQRLGFGSCPTPCWPITCSRPGTGLVRVHVRFTTARREVWLTIDDGPDRKTPAHSRVAGGTQRARDVLCDRGNAALHPELIGRWQPPGTRWRTTRTRIPRGVLVCFAGTGGSGTRRGLDALRLAGVRPTRFRPPAGIKNLWLAPALTARGLTCLGWSARGLERWPGDVETVATRVLRRLTPGDSPASRRSRSAGGHSGPSHPPRA